MTEKDGILSFKKLNELNYVSWKRDMIACLASKGLSDLAAGSTPTETRQFNIDKSKAGGMIFLGIEDNLKCLLDGISEPDKRWDKLAKTYEPKSKARIARLLGQFYLAQMQPNESIILFLNRIRQLSLDLELVEKKIDDSDIAYRMLCTLPPQYDVIVSQIYKWPDGDMIPPKVEEALIEEYENLKLRDQRSKSSNGDNALSATGKAVNKNKSNTGVICYNCGLKEHYSKDCCKKSKRKVTCTICKIVGHYATSCRKGKPPKGQSSSSSVSFSSFDDALIIDTMNVTANTNEWIWDTGSGAHLCHDENLFIQLTRNKPYKMNAYSGIFDVEGVGTVRFNHLIGRVNHRITLNNVGFAPSGKRNLISGSRAMEAGCSWTGKQNEILVKNKNNKPMLKFIKDKIKNRVPIRSKVNVTENKPNGDLELWHRRLMHTNIDTLVKMSKENFDTNNEDDRGNLTPTPISKPEQTRTKFITPKTEQPCVDMWERRAKQRPQTGSHPGRYDAKLSHRGQSFRSAKAVVKYCEDNSIGYSLESVKDSFKYNNPYIGTRDIAKVADGESVDSPTDSPDEGVPSTSACGNEAHLADLNEKTKLRAVNLLNKAFKCVDLGETKRFLGIDIVREPDGIQFSQIYYLDELSKRFSNFAFKRVAEPFKVGFDLAELNLEGDILNSHNYPHRTLVGVLLFVSRYTRPDICIAIGILARYNAKPTLVHWNCLLHLRYYVLSTKEKTIHLSKNFDLGINCFVDASWATSPADRKSITGYIVCIGNNPVIWRTAKQNLVTMSAMESELIALSELTKEVIWFKHLLDEITNVRGINFSKVSVNCDIRATIHFISNDVENSKTKYIDVKLQFVKENYQKNLADILTKCVNREKINKLCKYLITVQL
uniref:CCHC-type domain-containing protein n=1 Tax=Strigamia maritima TaxID=126957 RepID=T1JLW1_STRMM